MARALVYSVMSLSAAGAVLCIVGSLLGATRIYFLPLRAQAVLLVGIFLIWLPTMILMNRLTRDLKRKDRWKTALRGCPPWMKRALWVVLGFVVVSFLFPFSERNLPILFPAGFYAVSFCVMYSLRKPQEFDAGRRCTNGHALSPLAKFCDECGAPAAPESGLVTPI